MDNETPEVPEYMRDPNSAWNVKRKELEKALMSAAEQLLHHTECEVIEFMAGNDRIAMTAMIGVSLSPAPAGTKVH